MRCESLGNPVPSPQPLTPEELEQTPARHEIIADAEGADELRQPLEPDRPVEGRHHVAGRRVAAVAVERVLLADQAVEGRADQPGLLDELELPLDVAGEAHE